MDINKTGIVQELTEKREILWCKYYININKCVKNVICKVFIK